MAGEDTDQGERNCFFCFAKRLFLHFNRVHVFEPYNRDCFIPPNNEQKLHRHCEKTPDEEASCLERTSKGFSWQSPNVKIASFLLMTLRMVLLFLKDEIATSPLSILGNDND